MPKTYMALCKGRLEEEEVQKLRDGVPLTGGLGDSAPAEVEIADVREGTTLLRIIISEGKNRQVRRMLLAVNSQVIRLARVAVGDVTLDVDEGRKDCRESIFSLR
ncbi:pseudouridine synthase [Baffinella frigidus]|nr:pseudouridine synthase [Cryptophyta sp. CCMP2293]